MLLTGANSLMGLKTGQFDGHTHVFHPDIPMAQEKRYSPHYEAGAKDLNDLLKQNNLNGAIIVQPSFLGADNSYLLKTLEKYRNDTTGIFKGVIALEPDSYTNTNYLDDMEKMGVIGVRLNLFKKAESFYYKDWQKTLDAVEKKGWHIELHCEAHYLSQILPTLTTYHSKIVIDHFGLINSLHQNELSVILEQPKEKIWIKISAPYRIPGIKINQCMEKVKPLRDLYLRHFGADKLVWGSDWPFTQYEDKVSYQNTLELLEP